MFPHDDEQRPPPFKEIAHHHFHHHHPYGGAHSMKKYSSASLMDLERTTTASTASSDEDDFSVMSGDEGENGHDQNQQGQEQKPLQQQQHQHQHVPPQQQTHLHHRLLQLQQRHLINQQLINATIQSKTEKVRHLLDMHHPHQVNINATDERYGASPLHYAAMQQVPNSHDKNENVNLVQLLLQHGANVLQQDLCTGNTALHHASAKNHINVALLLLQHGASTAVPNKAGQTPVDVAANESMAATLRNYHQHDPPPRSVSLVPEHDKIVTGQKEEHQQTTRLATPKRVEVAQENFDKQSTEKVQQQRQQQQQRNLNNTTQRGPATFQTKKLQEQHQADMAALQDIVKTLQISIQQCKQEQQQQRASANIPAVSSNSNTSDSLRNMTEKNDIDDNTTNNTSLLQSLQDENAALRHTVATLQMEYASLHEKLSSSADGKQSQQQQQQQQQQQDPKASTKAESDNRRSTIFREKQAVTATTANIFNSSSSTGRMNSVDNRERLLKEQNKGLQEKVVAMQDTIECYKLEMACLQEQLRASQKQQQQHQTPDHHHRQHHVNPLQLHLHQRVRSSSNKKQYYSKNDPMTISTEQELQNILSDLLALTRRYMEERDNCQNNMI